MENEVIEFDIGLGGRSERSVEHDGLEMESFGGIVEEEDTAALTECSCEGNGFGEVYTPAGDLQLEPYEGMEFESEEAAKSFYNSYARRIGFSTRVSSSRRSRRDGAIIQRSFVCAKEGFRNLNEKRTKEKHIKRPRMVTRVGCKASLSVKIHESGRWNVSGFVKEHNHELVLPDQVHFLRSHRQISGPAKTLIDTLQAAGLGPRRIMSALIREYGGSSNVGFTEVDCRNYVRNNRQGGKERGMKHVVDYLTQMQADNSTFFFAVQGEEKDECVGNIFWADSKAQKNYTYFGDTVTFDTTYRSNKFRLPFASFTGVNHHGQPVFFGCAFLKSESMSSFIWLFQTWLMAMSGRHPVSITTDYDSVIESAVTNAFPNTRHRFCKWHISKKFQEKLSYMFVKHPKLESDFHKYVSLTDSIEEFESCWMSLIEEYGLKDQEWLEMIYNARKKWVPVYLRDTFFAEMSVCQCGDSMNSFFDGFLNASTNSTQFLMLYEKAIQSRSDKEVKADYDTLSSSLILRTPSPMERQASELYTRKLFVRFQEELVLTLTCMVSKMDDDGELATYKVSKYGDDSKSYLVKFKVIAMRASCSCKMFEFSGLLCCHILAVFRVENVLTLPPHYVLKRWTRNAKINAVLEERTTGKSNGYLESHTFRYNTLRHEAVKFVREGMKSIASYNASLIVLREATNRVDCTIQNERTISMVSGHEKDGAKTNGGLPNDEFESNFDHHMSEDDDDMDRKIEELNYELECAKHRSEGYRKNLLSVLKEVNSHKEGLSIKVQNIKLDIMGM